MAEEAQVWREEEANNQRNLIVNFRANYVEFQRCRLKHDDGHPDCRKYLRSFTSICPTEWVREGL